MTMRSSCNIHAGARRNTASSRRPTSASCRAGSSRWSWTECRKEASASATCVCGSRTVWSCRSARATSASCSAWSGRCLDSGAMVTMSSEYSIYLYREKVDLRKGISGLSGIVRDEMRLNPNTAKSVYVFSGRNPRIKKILVREHNRYELTQIRLDNGRFFRPVMDESRRFGKISWSDLVLLTEASVSGNVRIKYID